MERRLLVAAGLSLVVLLTWEWIGPKPPKRVAPIVETPVAAASRDPGRRRHGATAAGGAAPRPSPQPLFRRRRAPTPRR